MNRKNIRIKDIARLAGVSVGTVDRVLHNRGRVSEDALNKVMKILEEIDYKPNLIARTLGSNKIYKIAVLMPDPSRDPYWRASSAGLELAEVEWSQYNIQVEQFPFNLGDKASFSAAANLAVDARPDGVLVAPIFYDEALPFFDQCKAQDIPYVTFNTHIPEVPAISFIGQNLYQSGRVGAELMMMGQHQPGKFAVLHLDEDIHNAVHLREKERGFREYCQEKSNGSFTVTTQDHTHPGHPGFEDEIAQLVRDPELRGVFISTSKGSFIVAGLIEKLGKKNFRVVGYDLMDESLQYLRHGTIDFLINQNPKRQAFVGIGHLVNHLLFKKSSPPVTLFPLEVITPQNVDSYLSSGFH